MLNGIITRSGPNGYKVLLYNASSQLGVLPESSELHEVLRQASDLVLSNSVSGPICGSEREFNVEHNVNNERYLCLSLVGIRWLITENKRPNARYPLRLTMLSDFEFDDSKSTSSNFYDDEDEN